MANENKNEKKQKTPKSKIAARVIVIILAILMVASSVGLIVSGCQEAVHEHQEEQDH
ncbi:MAG: hypothetical protein IJ039_05690 [Clostridia bacterium]|nr:hypothetical protein [Clostridia bacterium]